MVVELSVRQAMREKRLFVRKEVNARVRLSHSTFGVVKTRTLNISDGGVFVELKENLRLPVGAHIKMQFVDSAMPEIAFNMKVVRCLPEGLALLFIDYELQGKRYNMDELRDQWDE